MVEIGGFDRKKENASTRSDGKFTAVGRGRSSMSCSPEAEYTRTLQTVLFSVYSRVQIKLLVLIYEIHICFLSWLFRLFLNFNVLQWITGGEKGGGERSTVRFQICLLTLISLILAESNLFAQLSQEARGLSRQNFWRAADSWVLVHFYYLHRLLADWRYRQRFWWLKC